MEHIDTIIHSMLNAGIVIPAAMIGFHFAYKRLITFIIPVLVMALIDHLLLQLLYIVDVQQNALVKLGAKLGQIEWGTILTKNIIEHIIAFFVVALVVAIITKLFKKIRS